MREPGPADRRARRSGHCLYRRLLCGLLALSIYWLALPETQALGQTDGQASQQLIHVGFFRFAGYHDMGASGNKSGYGYDFLQMIAGYANFRYVYVGYQKSWNDMLDLLDSGEIDMLTYGIKLPEYTARFDFSEHSIGTSAALLTASSANSAIAAHDYQPYDGMRVGMIAGANRKTAFDSYAAEKGFSYVPVYYPDLESLKSALAAGSEIDAMIADELRVLSDEVIIDRFDPQDIYVMVKKGNTGLLRRIDEAIRQLTSGNPGWAGELQDKYFRSVFSSSPTLTLTESQYLEGLRSKGQTLQVLFNPVGYPLSYYEGGQAQGILVDIFKKAADSYGLPCQFIKIGSLDDYYQDQKKKRADIIIDFSGSTDDAEVLGYRLTSAYAEADSSRITATSFSGTPQSAAVIEGSKAFYNIAKADNPRMKIIYCDTFIGCLNTVRSGRADCTYAYSATAQIFAIEDNLNRIKASPLSGTSFQFRIAVSSEADMTLYGILNKTAQGQSSAKTNELLNEYLLKAKREYTLWEYFMDNPAVLISVALAVALTLVGFILYQKRSALRLKASNDALESSRSALEEALDQANLANEAKTRFLSQMSHDIRTPLNGIIGMTGIAAANVGDPARVADSLDKISRCSDHLLTLINDILDLNRIESGKMPIAHEPTDIRATISQCAEILRSSVIGRKLDIEVDTPPIECPFVLTDALHVRQILINLISNAVKFTPDGGKITFRALGQPDPDKKILSCRFEVTDTGIGMSEEFQAHIGEAFVQEDANSARTQFKGSGLGMAIVRQYVVLLGGKLAIVSHPGQGTSVAVELPLEIDKDAAAHPAAPAKETRYAFPGSRVLLAEDNAINLEIAKVMLESHGISVDTAEDGRIAVDKFTTSPRGYYQCILMDVMMPVMDGYQAARTIRALERPDARDIPIIAMTANAFAEDIKEALGNGMNAHIAKPINEHSVMETLAPYLRTD